MKKTAFSLFWLAAALLTLALGACRSIQGESKCNREAPDIHTSRTSLDWLGIYSGIIPSASGQMIDVFLVLKLDDKFELYYSHVDTPSNSFFTTGQFKWDKTERNIILEAKDFLPYYRVVSDQLIQLDNNGKVITGGQAENYALKKIEPELGFDSCK